MGGCAILFFVNMINLLEDYFAMFMFMNFCTIVPATDGISSYPKGEIQRNMEYRINLFSELGIFFKALQEHAISSAFEIKFGIFKVQQKCMICHNSLLLD